LIGQFLAAENVLKRAVKEMSKGGIFAVSPQVLIQPLEMLEGGLSEVEERNIEGTRNWRRCVKGCVWVGHELSDPK